MAEQKGKYQPWSHEEFMADRRVRRMPSVTLKTYMMLLHEAFVCETRPNLPDNEEELELMAYCSDHEEWLSVRDTVLGMFRKETIDGVNVLVNKRLNRDWENLQQIRESLSERGKSGAAKRWGSRAIAEPSEAMADDSMEVSKEVSKEVSNEREEKEESISDSLSETDGQELPGDWSEEIMKTEKQIEILTQQFFGKKAFLRGRNGEGLKTLILMHKGSSVERAYDEWCELNYDNPDIKDPVAVFLEGADEFLRAESPARAAAKDPEVVSLVRELTYASDGVLAFVDKQRVRLSEVLKEFSAEEILSVFKIWLSDQDLNDPKNVSFLPGKFVQIADSLAYSARKRKQEQDKTQAARDAKALQMQEEAESERKKAEAARAEEESFDPLSGLV